MSRQDESQSCSIPAALIRLSLLPLPLLGILLSRPLSLSRASVCVCVCVCVLVSWCHHRHRGSINDARAKLETDPRGLCEELMTQALGTADSSGVAAFQMGKTKVFLRQGKLEELDQVMQRRLAANAVLIQKIFKGRRARNEYKEKLSRLMLLQIWIIMMRLRRRKRKAAIKLQKGARRFTYVLACCCLPCAMACAHSHMPHAAAAFNPRWSAQQAPAIPEATARRDAAGCPAQEQQGPPPVHAASHRLQGHQPRRAGLHRPRACQTLPRRHREAPGHAAAPQVPWPPRQRASIAQEVA